MKVEQFKALARQAMQRDGVPADQIEARLDAMVAAAQKPLPRYTAPKAESMPPPGFGEGFADRWFSTEQGIKELLGQGGPGAPGVLESWGGLLEGTAEQVTNPVGTVIDEVKDALDSPASPTTWARKQPTERSPRPASSSAARLPSSQERERSATSARAFRRISSTAGHRQEVSITRCPSMVPTASCRPSIPRRHQLPARNST